MAVFQSRINPLGGFTARRHRKSIVRPKLRLSGRCGQSRGKAVRRLCDSSRTIHRNFAHPPNYRIVGPAVSPEAFRQHAKASDWEPAHSPLRPAGVPQGVAVRASRSGGERSRCVDPSNPRAAVGFTPGRRPAPAAQSESAHAVSTGPPGRVGGPSSGGLAVPVGPLRTFRGCEPADLKGGDAQAPQLASAPGKERGDRSGAHPG